MARPEIKAVAEIKSKIGGITAVGSSTDTLACYVLAKNGLASAGCWICGCYGKFRKTLNKRSRGDNPLALSSDWNGIVVKQ